MMSSSLQLLLACAITCTLSSTASAVAIDLIGGTGSGALNENGGFDAVTPATTNSAFVNGGPGSSGGLESVVNSNTTGAFVQIPGFRITRLDNSGGSSQFGFDNSTGTALDGFPGGDNTNTVATANNGILELTADSIDLGAGQFVDAGSTFTVSYDIGWQQENSGAAAINLSQYTSTLGVGGLLLTPDSVLVSGLPAESSIQGDNSVIFGSGISDPDTFYTITQTFTVPGGATSALVDLTISLDGITPTEAASGDANFVRLNVDNVNLSGDVTLAVPEPNAVALSLLALSGFGAVGMRNRLG